MGRPGSLVFALLAAFFGVQSDAFAGMITSASGSMQLEACDFAGVCNFVNPQIQFPPNSNTQQINGPDVGMGTSVAYGNIAFQSPTSPNQSPTSQISAYVTGYPSSMANVLVTLDFEFQPVSPGAPPGAPGEVMASGGVQDAVSGDTAYASVMISEETATPSTVFSACAVVGSVSCVSSLTKNPFSVSQSISFIPNQIYSLQLQISLSFDNSTGGNHNANASIDPVIINDDPSDFELLVSPNLTATPLPATWTTMLIGLVGLGSVTYRRRKITALLAV
jgi:hypothetical protein